MLNYDLKLPDADLSALRRALRTEGDTLDEVVSATDDWTKDTPAEGWSIAHQVAHLADADSKLLQALTHPARFATEADAGGLSADEAAAAGAARLRTELLHDWRSGRRNVLTALEEHSASAPFPWFGSDVDVSLMTRLRFMETWAHGQDVMDTVVVPHYPRADLRFIVELGIAGRGLSFAVAGEGLTQVPYRLELSFQDGSVQSWGQPAATESIVGDAMEFCLVVTRRRHLDDTGLVENGRNVQTWMENARVFL